MSGLSGRWPVREKCALKQRLLLEVGFRLPLRRYLLDLTGLAGETTLSLLSPVRGGFWRAGAFREPDRPDVTRYLVLLPSNFIQVVEWTERHRRL